MALWGLALAQKAALGFMIKISILLVDDDRSRVYYTHFLALASTCESVKDAISQSAAAGTSADAE